MYFKISKTVVPVCRPTLGSRAPLVKARGSLED